LVKKDRITPSDTLHLAFWAKRTYEEAIAKSGADAKRQKPALTSCLSPLYSKYQDELEKSLSATSQQLVTQAMASDESSTRTSGDLGGETIFAKIFKTNEAALVTGEQSLMHSTLRPCLLGLYTYQKEWKKYLLGEGADKFPLSLCLSLINDFEFCLENTAKLHSSSKTNGIEATAEPTFATISRGFDDLLVEVRKLTVHLLLSPLHANFSALFDNEWLDGIRENSTTSINSHIANQWSRKIRSNIASKNQPLLGQDVMHALIRTYLSRFFAKKCTFSQNFATILGQDIFELSDLCISCISVSPSIVDNAFDLFKDLKHLMAIDVTSKTAIESYQEVVKRLRSQNSDMTFDQMAYFVENRDDLPKDGGLLLKTILDAMQKTYYATAGTSTQKYFQGLKVPKGNDAFSLSTLFRI